MFPFMNTTALVAAKPPFVPVTTERSGVTQTSIPVPNGATKALIECIGWGGPSVGSGGGWGGNYAKRISADLSGISNLYVDIGTVAATSPPIKQSTQVRANNSSGNILCSAQSGTQYSQTQNSSSDTGDVKYTGGKPGSTGLGGVGGGGAGRTGNGGDASSANNGSIGIGSSPGGDGGTNNTSNNAHVGKIYGGGSGSQSSYDDEGNPNGYLTAQGASGWVSITFS